MKKEIKKLFKNAKFIAGANLVALLFSGTVGAKSLSDKECQEKYEGKLLAFNTDFPSDNGCECDNVYTMIDQATGNINFVQGNCRRLKPLSDKECKKQFDGKLLYDGFPGDKGCTCDSGVSVIDETTEDIDFVQENCRAMTAEEKAFLDLFNNQGYDCIGECQSEKRIDCLKDKNCKILANRKCANVDVPNADNGLSYEEYYNILKKAKKCQAPADKLIKQVIKSQGR